MKKPFKMLLSLMATLMMTIGIALPTVSAQDTNWDEVLTQINTVSQELVSMEGDGVITVSVQDLLDATLTTDFRYNTEERFALDASADIEGELASTDSEGNATTTPLNFGGQVAVVEGVAYLFDGSSWTVEDVSEQEEQIASQFDEIMTQATESSQALNDPAMVQKYFDLSETDTEYVMTLKSDINPEEFWADVESQVNLEEIKQESIDQAIEQAQASGTELTAEEIAELEEQIDSSFEVAKEIGFQLINSLEMRYAKDTYYMTYMSLDIGLDYADIEEIAANIGESMEGVPENFNMAFTMVFNFRNHGQVFDIVVPEGAPTFDASESAESASEESTDDTTGESTEDTVEEPTEDSTEEPAEDSTEEPTEDSTEEPAAEESTDSE